MSDQYNIIILPEAQEDIEKIVLYIAKQYFDPLKALELQNVLNLPHLCTACLEVGDSCEVDILEYQL